MIFSHPSLEILANWNSLLKVFFLNSWLNAHFLMVAPGWVLCQPSGWTLKISVKKNFKQPTWQVEEGKGWCCGWNEVPAAPAPPHSPGQQGLPPAKWTQIDIHRIFTILNTKGSLPEKKMFSFGHCPNYLSPPLTPFRATCTSFLAVKNEYI